MGKENLELADGVKYTGEVLFGVPHGQGTMTDPDLAYVGQFKDGEFHGQGSITYPDGDEYVGEFRFGKFNGHGTATFGEGEFEGEKFVGEFKDEEWWNGTVYDSEGNVVSTWSEGEPE